MPFLSKLTIFQQILVFTEKTVKILYKGPLIHPGKSSQTCKFSFCLSPLNETWPLIFVAQNCIKQGWQALGKCLLTIQNFRLIRKILWGWPWLEKILWTKLGEMVTRFHQIMSIGFRGVQNMIVQLFTNNSQGSWKLSTRPRLMFFMNIFIISMLCFTYYNMTYNLSIKEIALLLNWLYMY